MNIKNLKITRRKHKERKLRTRKIDEREEEGKMIYLSSHRSLARGDGGLHKNEENLKKEERFSL